MKYRIKQRILSLFITSVFMLNSVSATAPGYKFTIFDALNVLKHIVGIEELNDAYIELYDYRGTGEIDIFNALEILKWLVWMDNAFGVNPNPKPPPPPPPPPDPPVIPPRPPKPNPKPDYIVTANQLRQMGWVESALTDWNVADLNNTLSLFGITTPNRIQHFISQCAHESGMGKWTRELASGIDYEFRSDLGNIYPGDGPRYKGAGYLQMTGRWNYQQFANYVGDQRVMEGVDYVAAYYPWLSAGFWWHNAGMNAFVDSGRTVEEVTRKVNGGLNGLSERIRLYGIAVSIFR